MTKLIPLLLGLALLAAPPLPAEQAPLPAGGKVVKDLAYVPGGHVRQKLDLYLPAKPTGPILVWIHGGGWVGGSRTDEVPGLQLLALGYTIASVDYRFSTDAPFPAQIEDCKAAIRWLRANAATYGYDPKRLAAWGGSAGGHLTALLATTGVIRDFDVGENLDQSSAIRCGIDFSGPTDFPAWKPASANPGIQRSGADSLLTKLLGGEMMEKAELARRASPVTWISKETAPLYLLHGDADEIVGVEQSLELAVLMKAVGVEVVLDIVPGADHAGMGFWKDPNRPQRLADFFAKYLAAP